MKFRNLLTFIIISFSFLTSCSKKVPLFNGVSFVASSNAVSQENIDPLIDLNVNNASVMPFGFIQNLNDPEVIYNTERQWFGETKEGAEQYIDLLHKNNIQVMLKPQIWVWRGEFTGLIEMNSEEDWLQLEESYRNFILVFAKLAEETSCALFCIGTEMEQFIMKRPEYWKALIQDIRNVYSGELTYAANWDEYKRIPFWRELDYIGVDAYFPISESKTPTIEESIKSWEKWKKEMLDISEKNQKKVLFTEYGYRSVDYNGKEPWKSDRSMNRVNLEAQSNTLHAMFESIWNEEWFAGGYLWKWFIDHSKVGGIDNHMFTPQNKPAAEIIKEKYLQYQ